MIKSWVRCRFITNSTGLFLLTQHKLKHNYGNKKDIINIEHKYPDSITSPSEESIAFL